MTTTQREALELALSTGDLAAIESQVDFLLDAARREADEEIARLKAERDALDTKLGDVVFATKKMSDDHCEEMEVVMKQRDLAVAKCAEMAEHIRDHHIPHDASVPCRCCELLRDNPGQHLLDRLVALERALRPAFNCLEAITTEKLQGRYCGHKGNKGHPDDWVLTRDAAPIAVGMSATECGFLAASANAVQEALAACKPSGGSEVKK